MYRKPIIFKLTSFLLIILMLSTPIISIAQTMGNDYLQGKMQGELDAKGNPLWIIAGLGCGIFGVGAAYFTKPSPPSMAIMGKSTEYILGYTEGYQNKSRNTNTGYACGGWAAWLVMYLLFLSSVTAETTY